MTHSHRKGFLEFPCGVERLPNGNTLIVDAGDESNTGSELLEVDPKGQIVWRHSDDLNFAHSVSLQKNGNYLITDTTNNRIVEIDRENRIAFTSDDWGDGTGKLSDGSHLSYPNDAHETTDGDFLVTDRNGNRCIIVSKEGLVRWEYSYGIKHPHNADLLPNGNVIIADSDQNRVIEVDRDHQVVWSYGDQPGHEALNWPRDADRLPNGNTLICDSKNSRVLEVTTDGQLVWSYGLPYFANLYEADRLSNGNTLISDQQRQRVFEVDSYGNVVWQFRNNVPSYSIYPKLHNGFFKQREESGLPEGWTLLTRMSEGGGELLWKQDERGKDFVGLEYRRHGALFLVQRVGVVPGRSYRLGGQIRADSISEGAFAAFQVAFRDNFGGLTQDAMAAPKGQMLVGTTDWIHDTVETVVPDSATSAEIRVMITGPGCTWVRGLMFMQSN
jgi:hypothetical protein